MQNASSKNYPAIFGLLFAAVTWGIIWYPYRLMQEAGISGVAATFYTYAMTLASGILIFARHWRGLLNMPNTVIWLGLAAGWTNLSYVLAVIHGEVMRVMLLFYLSPLWTLVLAHFWLQERTGKLGITAIAASLLGAFIMLWQPESIPLPQNTAEWLGLSSGMGFALTNVITRKSRHLTLLEKSFPVWVGVIGVALVFQLFHHTPFPAPEALSTNNWLLMGLIAMLLMAATLLVQYGITHTPVTRASVIFLFELVVAAIASYYLAGESMDWHEWLGGSLIVTAAVIAAKAEEAQPQ